MTERFIPYGHQSVSDTDIEAVVAVLRSDWLTQGPAVPAFERAVAQYCGAAHAVAVNSGTSGLHIACLALGVGPGDVVWTSPITFVASANCARYCGAGVDFVDIDPQTWCLSVSALEEKLRVAARARTLPKVVIPVHFGGQACDMTAIGALSREYGFRVVEDAAHALGGRYLENPVGSCRHSDITMFSFHPVKSITTGEGGMVVTNRPDLADQMSRLRSHGVTREPGQMSSPDGPWSYEQVALGFNYRMTDLEAALGLSQLGRLDRFIERRNELAARYDQVLGALPLRRQTVPDGVRSARHLYPIRVCAEQRLNVFRALCRRGIGVNVHYSPVHLQPVYRRLGFTEGQFPQAEAYYRDTLTIPLHAAMTNDDQDRVVHALQASLDER